MSGPGLAGVADAVVCMDAFRARDVTAEAHAIDARFGASPALEAGGGAAYGPVRDRVPVSILPTPGVLQRPPKIVSTPPWAPSSRWIFAILLSLLPRTRRFRCFHTCQQSPRLHHVKAPRAKSMRCAHGPYRALDLLGDNQLASLECLHSSSLLHRRTGKLLLLVSAHWHIAGRAQVA